MAKKKLTIEDVLVPREEIPYEVPENWCWVKLGSVIKLISGRDIPAKLCNDEGKGIPYILGASNIKQREFIPERWIEEPVVIAEKGDILVSCKGTIGKTIILEQEQIHISRQIMALRCSELINVKYLKFYIDTYVSTLIEKSKGLIPGITRDDVISIELPLPPLAEQVRLVNRIESLFDKVDMAAGLVDEARDGFEKRRAAILSRAFRGELTNNGINDTKVAKLLEEINRDKEIMIKDKIIKKEKKIELDKEDELYNIPSHWKWINLSHICNKITDGAHNTPNKLDEGYRYITAQHVKDGFIDFENSFYMSEADHRELYNKCTPEKGDILIVNIGAGSGNVAIIDADFEFSFKNIAILKLNKRINSKYIYYHQLYDKKRILETISRGGAQPFLSLTILKKLSIPLPPREEQDKIVSILDKLFEEEINIEELSNINKNIDTIKKSILAKAFRGELGSNNLDEESSMNLINQIID